MNRFRNWLKRINARTVLQYLCFVVVAAVFWCFITLNKTSQQDLVLKFELVDVPKDVTFINDLPESITITMRDKGSSFAKYLVKSLPTVRVKFNDFVDLDNNRFVMNTVQLRNVIKRTLNKDDAIENVMPENIIAKFTTLPGKRVPIVLNLDIEADVTSVVNGNILMSTDSATVFGTRDVLSTIKEVKTSNMRLNGLTDTMRYKIPLLQIEGARIEPKNINVTIPVEPLVKKSITVPVTVKNSPSTIKLALYHSSVDVSYLVPL
ncbi:MAG: hypothetical protein IK092_06585, partial [Muribaculaceae bacterium]|nr:hypothetical protein [Muribaculaceae bacterium]